MIMKHGKTFSCKTHNKAFKPVSGLRPYTGQPKLLCFCAFASQIIAQKHHNFACRLTRRYKASKTLILKRFVIGKRRRVSGDFAA
ncbi:hypothetical protein TERTU_1773 [Teredinibacter turnerae T7901]|uniref:Uncharacterized protein n=1 Tax=Teredinibacter turnerae (strain ATCC 39867 / T7901) TaxID=377629 RepID=C6AR05_TERTT|nr:hypothetical protein TERTU_1773 [Teredinibacter turnerae T7901]